MGIDGRDPPLARADHSSPLLLSNCVSTAKDDSLEALDPEQHVVGYEAKDSERRTYLRRMRYWVENMGIDKESNRATTLYLPESEARFLESAPTTGCPDSTMPAGRLTVTGYSVGLTRASVSYHSGDDGFLRLAFSWYPTLEVLLDGGEVKTARSLFGGIVLRTPQGDHTLELIPTRPPHTLPVILGTAAGMALCLLGWILAARRRPPREHPPRVR
jgi:hypothetical protein